MSLSRAIKQLRDIAAFLLFVALVVLANQAYYVLEDFRKLEAKTSDAIDESRRAISDTSKMVNANLIHLDLILGRAERVSRRQEAYWDMMALKSARLLDNANKVVVDLDANQNAISAQAVTTLQETQRSIVLLGETAQHTDQTINGKEIREILQNVDKGTASLSLASDHGEKAMADVQEQVHRITHPSALNKIATWTLRVVHAIGSWF